MWRWLDSRRAPLLHSVCQKFGNAEICANQKTHGICCRSVGWKQRSPCTVPNMRICPTPRPTPSRHRETLGRRSDKVSAPPDYACKLKGRKTVKSHGIRDRNHTHSNDDTMGSGIESIPYTQCANFAKGSSSLIPRNHLRFTIFFTHGNVSILKTQRRIHGDARRPCRRSSPRFLLFTPPRVFFEPGTSATRLSHRGRIAEIFA